MKREMVTNDRGEVPVSRACKLLTVTRSGYYRSLVPKPDRDAVLRERVIQLTEAFPEYGYRRIVPELDDLGYPENAKRVLRVMRACDRLCKIRRRKSPPRTTDSNHDQPVYQDLTRNLELTGPNQLWVADISYLRVMGGRFVYVATLMDAWSRRVVGWEVMAVQDARLVLSALEKALASREVPPGLIHHSDRGTQYASEAYVRRLREAGLVPSMARRGHPRDNPQAESLFATLKCEHVHRTEYEDLVDAREQVAAFLLRYNGIRRHSALGYLSPERFEAAGARALPKCGSDRRRKRSGSAQVTPRPIAAAPQRREATTSAEHDHLIPQHSTSTTHPYPST
jgi:putative transposase